MAYGGFGVDGGVAGGEEVDAEGQLDVRGARVGRSGGELLLYGLYGHLEVVKHEGEARVCEEEAVVWVVDDT